MSSSDASTEDASPPDQGWIKPGNWFRWKRNSPTRMACRKILRLGRMGDDTFDACTLRVELTETANGSYELETINLSDPFYEYSIADIEPITSEEVESILAMLALTGQEICFPAISTTGL